MRSSCRGTWARGLAVVAGLSLAALACGLGGLSPASVVEEQIEQQIEEQIQEQLPENVDPEIVGDVLEQVENADVNVGLEDSCPVVTLAEVQAATGEDVIFNFSLDTPELLNCNFNIQSGVVNVQVLGAGIGEDFTEFFNVYAGNILGPVEEGQAVSGPWEEALLYDGTGIIYRKDPNIVVVLASDANAATQLATQIAGRLPYTPSG